MTLNLESEFPINDLSQSNAVTYLNHAAVAPWPLSSQKAVEAFARENVQTGAAGYLKWLDVEKELRSNLCKILGTQHQESVALVKNTSEALSMVAYGLDWNEGDVVLISDEEFPSNRIVWQSLASKGVQTIEVSLDKNQPEQSLINAIKKHKPRLLSISAVQYASGIRVDLAALGKTCKENNVLYCVDAIQSLGAMPFNCDDWQIDFSMADGHKWLLGPEGLGVFYVAPHLLEKLDVYEFGWHMIENAGDYSTKEWTIAKDATRFECGSPNLLASHALNASLKVLLEFGLDNIQNEIQEKIQYLKIELEKIGAEIISSTNESTSLGIICFKFNDTDSAKLYKDLMSQKVICANRGGGVRFSPHFHTTKEVMDNAITILKQLIQN